MKITHTARGVLFTPAGNEFSVIENEDHARYYRAAQRGGAFLASGGTPSFKAVRP